jgi:histidinol dehydrogenase
MPHFLDTSEPGFEARFSALLAMKREDAPEVDDAVAAIIADVRARGDAALIALTERFDRLRLTPDTLAFSTDEIDAAVATVPPAERDALEAAAERIRAYHVRQMPDDRAGPTPRARRSVGAGRRCRRPGSTCRAGSRPIRPPS